MGKPTKKFSKNSDTTYKSMTDVKRQKYWILTMDKAYEFMKQASNVPVNECMEKLVYLPEVAREAGVEVTFSDKPHVDNLPRLFYLRQGQIENFLKIADKFNSHGWIYTPLDRGRCRYYKSCANISSKYGT